MTDVVGKQDRRVLLFVWGGIGNMVMALPMIDSIRLATADGAFGLVAQKGLMVDLVERPRSGIMIALDEPRFTKLGGLGRLVATLRGFKPDCAVSTVAFPRVRYGLLALLSGAPVRICEDAGPNAFCNSPVKTAGRHTVARNLELLATIGIDGRLSHVRLSVPVNAPGVSNGADTNDPRPPIGLFPGAGHSFKRWPPERFIALGKELARRFAVIVFAGPGEPGLGEEVAAGIGPGARPQSGPLRDMLSQIARCRLFIGNDTGPSHCAAALGVPTIALFGPTDPDVTGPFGQRVVCMRSEEPCGPCYRGRGKYNCTHHSRKCLEGITVEQVLAAANEMLTQLS
jgi:ADP-heptose:LPS heptosyltransferase